MDVMGWFKVVLLVLLQLTWQPHQSRALPCPAPFSLQAGLCLLVNASQNSTWCSANKQCSSIGGELINSHDSIKLFRENIAPSINSTCELWVGISDLADDRKQSRSGWLRVNGNGVFPEDDSLFYHGEPSGGNGDSCIRLRKSVDMADGGCKSKYGFVCEFVQQPQLKSPVTFWTVAAFKREAYTNAYCYADIAPPANKLQCVTAALTSTAYSRQVLYNSRLKMCRLLQFTDSQVEESIETSDDWVKYSLV